MFKKIAFFLLTMCIINLGWADCAPEKTVYTKCKPGYYLNDETCEKCPDTIDFDASPTSENQNTGGITDCYVPRGTYSDGIGTFTWDEPCYFKEQ